jgi:DnaK suppressor protein
MNTETTKRFQEIFEQEKSRLLYSHSVINQDFALQDEDRMDAVDHSASELEQSMRMRLRNREALYLKKIDAALARIRTGDFGLCQSCEEDININRLLARPTTTLCINCKEDEERNEQIFSDGHGHKSIGAVLKMASA